MDTGTSCDEIERGVLVPCFQLAHRWATSHVLPMLERMLASFLTDESFEEIAEIAVLQGSNELEQACIMFANSSKGVRRRLREGAGSMALRKLLGYDPHKLSGKKRKDRRSAPYDIWSVFWILLGI